MAAIEDEILNEFFERLSGVEGITPRIVEGLRPLLTSDTKLKPDEIAWVFSLPEAETTS
jgi:hypothetical protein